MATNFRDLRQRGFNQRKITLAERFDRRALAYLASLSADDFTRLDPTLSNEKALARMQCSKKYFEAVPCGTTLKTAYHQTSMGKTLGRFFADGGLSQQGMSKALRHTLSRELYLDLDFVNCHPALLSQLCAKIGIEAPFLTSYASNREAILSQMDMPREKAKKAINAAINGNVWLPNVQGWPMFIAEIGSVREAVLKAHPRIAKWVKAHPSDVGKDGGLSLVLNDLENQCVLALADFMQRQGFEVGTLCFDGLHVARDERINSELLEKATDFVEAETGYRLELSIKPMDAGIAVPDDFVAPEEISIAATHLKAARMMLQKLSLIHI